MGLIGVWCFFTPPFLFRFWQPLLPKVFLAIFYNRFSVTCPVLQPNVEKVQPLQIKRRCFLDAWFGLDACYVDVVHGTDSVDGDK